MWPDGVEGIVDVGADSAHELRWWLTDVLIVMGQAAQFLLLVACDYFSAPELSRIASLTQLRVRLVHLLFWTETGVRIDEGATRVCVGGTIVLVVIILKYCATGS